jgi:hypothetical protein
MENDASNMDIRYRENVFTETLQSNDRELSVS